MPTSDSAPCPRPRTSVKVINKPAGSVTWLMATTEAPKAKATTGEATAEADSKAAPKRKKREIDPSLLEKVLTNRNR